MTKQTILVGTVANDGTGDTLRSAGLKINNNFNETYSDILYIHEKSNVSSNLSQTIFNNSNTANILAQAAYTQANTAANTAQAAFDYANTIVSDTQVDPYARVTANAAFLAANTGNTLAQAAFDVANTYIGATSNTLTDGTETLTLTSNVLVSSADIEINAPLVAELSNEEGCWIGANNQSIFWHANDSELAEFSDWSCHANGVMVLPTDAQIVSPFGAATIGNYDITASSSVGAYTNHYSTSANNAFVEICARDDASNQNKIQILSDNATNTQYISINTYDGGNYGIADWQFRNNGVTRFPIAFAPTSSVGSTGDTTGLIAFTQTHMYFCVGVYDGTSDIWRRMEWNAVDTW